MDLRLTRRVQIGERIRLNLTADVFNLFNRVNIEKVDTAFTQSGRPVSSFNPRQIQFGVRISF